MKMGERNKMIEATAVKAVECYRIWIRFDDGTEGEIDLSHLAGKGVFKAWEDRAFFEAVRIASYGAVTWGEDLDLCPDSFYAELVGTTIEEAEREPSEVSVYA